MDTYIDSLREQAEDLGYAIGRTDGKPLIDQDTGKILWENVCGHRFPHISSSRCPGKDFREFLESYFPVTNNPRLYTDDVYADLLKDSPILREDLPSGKIWGSTDILIIDDVVPGEKVAPKGDYVCDPHPLFKPEWFEPKYKWRVRVGRLEIRWNRKRKPYFPAFH